MKRIKRVLLFLVLALLGFTFLYSSTRAVTITVKGVDIIYANPGENCMSEVTISWHSSTEASKLVYTVASDPNYEQAIEVPVTGVYDETSFIYYDVCKFYKCKVELKGLQAGTDYIYKVSSGDVTSREHHFKTAGTANFTFGYMSDIHAVPYDNLDLGMTAVKKLQTVQTLIDKSTKVSGELSFMLTTGDEVWRGSQYTNWLEWSKNQYTTATEDYLWAGAPGNHEYYTQTTSSVWNYYPEKYASNTDAIYSDPDYFYNTYFNAVKAVPQNGPEGIPSSYWFLYNNVLFVCIDSMQSSEYKKLETLRSWFEEVVTKNEGKYQFLIAYQHYPWYDFQTGVDKYAYRWNDLFDKYGVDLALSGHMHGYLRTKQLYNGKVSNDDTKGTYYVVSPQIGDRPKSITSYNNVDLIETWESTVSYKDYSAMSTIEVTKEYIKYRLIDVDGKIKDEFVIKAKRSYSLNQEIKNQASKGISISSNANTITANMDPNQMQYVKNIQLIADNTYVKSCDPSTKKVSSVTLANLDANKVYDLRVNITYIDGLVETKNYKIATGEKYNLLDNVKLKVDNGIKLEWEKKENPSKYNILVDDTVVATIDGNSTSYTIASGYKLSSKYTLQALNASGEVIFMKELHYSNYYGDCNLDGKVDKNDVNALLDLLVNDYKFDEYETKLLDNNKDNRVDVGDAFRILSYANKKVDNIKVNTYLVVIVDASGNVLGSEEVQEGADLTFTAPEITGKTFVSYSLSSKNISSDMVLVAIYE